MPNDTPVSAPVSASPATSTSAAPETNQQPSQATPRAENGQFTKPTSEAKPDANSPTPAAQKPPPKKMKLKVDGREEELSEDDVLKWAQMGKASQKRFQEAAAERKKAEEFITMLKSDPLSVLTNPAIGVDVRKFAEDFLINELKKEQLSPEQLKIQELENKIKAQEDAQKKAADQKRQEEFQKLQEQFRQDYEKKIVDTLQTSGLPKTPKTIKRMTDYMIVALQNNLELEPKDIVSLVKSDYMSEITDLFSQTEGDALLQILGDGVANKIRKADLARLRASASPVTPQVPTAKPELREEPESKIKKPLNVYEWREEIERRVRGDK